MKMKDEIKDDDVLRLTPWGCLQSVLDDYDVDTHRITNKVGGHIVTDFFDLMAENGYITKKGES